MVIEYPTHTTYTGKDAMGSLEECIRAECGNPDRLLSPCPSIAHNEDPGDWRSRLPKWHFEDGTDAQKDLLWELGAGEDWTDFELDNLTKGECHRLISDYQDVHAGILR